MIASPFRPDSTSTSRNSAAVISFIILVDAQLVEHTAQHYRRGALGGTQEAEGPGLPQSPGQPGAGVEVYDGHTDNHRRQAVHQLAGTHGGGEAAGFVADDAAAEGHQGVGDHQPQDLYCASVLARVVTRVALSPTARSSRPDFVWK